MVPHKIVYVGRLEENTGLPEFFKWFRSLVKRYEVVFVGDGVLRKECEKYGQVCGFTNPAPYLRQAEYCVPGGYLAAFEGLSSGCKLKLFWNNKVKEDYWKMSPFMRKSVAGWAKHQSWQKVADEYLNLYNSLK
jgi:glycosyltransferase involved in cell wall biosynthesis